MKKVISLFLLFVFCINLYACKNDTVDYRFDEAAVRDTISFGSYEQNNIHDDGSEPIQWLVLAKDSNKLLLISTQLLDIYQYNSNENSVTWEDCTLRAWLNSTFYEAAFNADERNVIVTTEVFTEGVQQRVYSSLLEKWVNAADPMPDCTTSDKIFILSEKELHQYFRSNTAVVAKPTTYTKLATANKAVHTDCWYTRTPADTVGAQKIVESSGFSNSGGASNECFLGVRPCIWVSVGNP